MKTNNLNQQVLELSGLIAGLKDEDTRNSKLTKRFQVIMLVFAPLYLTLFVVNIFSDLPWQQNLGMFFFAFSFLIFALIFRKFNREYSSVDYGIPTVEMLSEAVKRYQFWQRKTKFSILPVVLVDLGLCFSSYNHLLTFGVDPLTRILIIQAIYIPVMSISITIGYFIWRYRQKPIRDSAMALLKEITGS